MCVDVVVVVTVFSLSRSMECRGIFDGLVDKRESRRNQGPDSSSNKA